MLLPLTVTKTPCMMADHPTGHKHCSIEDANGHTVVGVGANMSEESADLIARNCNCFDELLAACEAAALACNHPNSDLCRQLNTAIAKAKSDN